MPGGFQGKVLRVNLSTGQTQIEEPPENFYRQYIGGSGFVGYFLLKEVKAGIDPLAPDNKLIFAPGVITGAPVSGSGRSSVGAKSPLTGGFGQADVGGYFGAELKRAGFDAIIVEGKAEEPTYISIQDGKVELRDARHLWGKTTGESQRLLQEELGDPFIRTAQIGPAGEKLVRFSCVMNDLSHAAGRTGMGAVMGSKNLKAVAVRGHSPLPLAHPEVVSDLARFMRDNMMNLARPFYDQGTSMVVSSLNRSGGLPTRNFREGSFEGYQRISGPTLRDTLLVARRSCFACAVRCKREVKVDEPYRVDPLYGGPEYETIASTGSNCGIDDLKAVAKANEICNAYGLDTISCGMAISFAMECFEHGILTEKDTDGLQLRFGNAQAMVTMVERIARREGLGALLGEGTARAARAIGKGAEEFALHVKGQELPMHEPRFKQGMGLGYAVSPTGADHNHNIHDSLYTAPGPYMEGIKALGVLEPLPANDLSVAKVRLLIYGQMWQHLLNCLALCQFVPFERPQVVKLVEGVTGWSTTGFELMKVGERALAMARLFNFREGFAPRDDRLPHRFFTPFASGPLSGVAIDPVKLEEARALYYRMIGWDEATGAPSTIKLEELGLGWAARELVR